MARACLVLAFVGGGLNLLLPRLAAHSAADWGRFYNVVLYVPAVLLGLRCWLHSRSILTSWPMLLCVLLVWLGLAHAEPTESKRGWLIAFRFSAALPIAALMIHERAWLLCARTYVKTCALAVAVTFYMQFFVEMGLSRFGKVPFGALSNSRGVQLVNPNEVGTQLAGAAMLALLLYLRPGALWSIANGVQPEARDNTSPTRKRESEMPGSSLPLPSLVPRAGVARLWLRGMAAGPRGNREAPHGLGLGWALLLSAACLLTASRSAMAAWLVGTGLVLVGARASNLGRLRDLVAVCAAGTMLVLFAAAAFGFTPWQRLEQRLFRDETMATLGSRTAIWQNARDAWLSNSKYVLFGAGTGSSGQVLGRFDEYAIVDSHGALYRNCHSSIVDWLLSYGLLGLAAGAPLIASLAWRAVRLDRRDPLPHRVAFLASTGVFALTSVVYQLGYWIALGPILLAMLAPVPARRSKSQRAVSEAVAAQGRAR